MDDFKFQNYHLAGWTSFGSFKEATKKELGIMWQKRKDSSHWTADKRLLESHCSFVPATCLVHVPVLMTQQCHTLQGIFMMALWASVSFLPWSWNYPKRSVKLPKPNLSKLYSLSKELKNQLRPWVHWLECRVGYNTPSVSVTSYNRVWIIKAKIEKPGLGDVWYLMSTFKASFVDLVSQEKISDLWRQSQPTCGLRMCGRIRI